MTDTSNKRNDPFRYIEWPDEREGLIRSTPVGTRCGYCKDFIKLMPFDEELPTHCHDLCKYNALRVAKGLKPWRHLPDSPQEILFEETPFWT